MARRGHCRYCDAPVIWVRTESGKTMPIDPMPNPAGNVIATGGGPGSGARARVLTTAMTNDPAYSGRDRYMPHAATCKKRPGPPTDRERSSSGEDGAR